MKKFLLIFFGLFFAFFLLYFLKISQFYQKIYAPNAQSTTKKTVEKQVYNLLLLGYAGGNHGGAYLTDTIMIAQINKKTKQVHLISLPRDLYVKVPSKIDKDHHAKINSIYQIQLFPDKFPEIPEKYTQNKNSIDLVKKTIFDVTGISIDNYATVDFQTFKKAIDTLGGVDINVQTTFDDFEYPIDGKEEDLCGKDEDFKKIEKYINPHLTDDEIKERDEFLKDKPDLAQFLKDITDEPNKAFPCRYEHLHFDQGVTHMDGETALKYVRSRHSLQDGNDFGRIKRQQNFLEAVREKVFTLSFIPRLIPLLDQLGDGITTDLSIADLKKYLKEANDSKDYSFKSIAISNENYLKDTYSEFGEYILEPTAGEDNWSKVKQYIKTQLAGIPLTPSPTVTLSIPRK